MIALPSLAAVPPRLVTPSVKGDQLAAQYALALAGKGSIADPRRGSRKNAETPELAVIRDELGDWLAGQRAKLTLTKFNVHLGIGRAPTCGCHEGPSVASLWLSPPDGDILGSSWALLPRWVGLQRQAAGLGETALHWLRKTSRLMLPLYAPWDALGLAEWHYWLGEEDERAVLDEIKANSDDPADHDIFTRKQFDAAIPACAASPKAKLSESRLDWLARRRGAAGELAGLVLELTAKAKIARRGKHSLHRNDQDDMAAVSFMAGLRWSNDDPAYQIFDDWAHAQSQSGYEEAFGWYPLADPNKLRPALKEIEALLDVSVVVEKILPLIATRERRQ